MATQKSDMPQIRGTFIKIECFKTKSCSSQKKMGRVHGCNITLYFFHTLPVLNLIHGWFGWKLVR